MNLIVYLSKSVYAIILKCLITLAVIGALPPEPIALKKIISYRKNNFNLFITIIF
jgi:hypothetical protein